MTASPEGEGRLVKIGATTSELLQRNTGSLAVSGTPLQLTTTELPQPLKKGVRLKVLPGETDNVFVGFRTGLTGNGTDATDGYPLDAGQEILIEVDQPNKIWLVSDGTDQELHYMWY
jgi:hypothetical protein